MRTTIAAMALVAALMGVASTARAAGELMVHPTRIVFDGTTRTAQVDLINSGSEPMTYRVSLINRRMTPTGDFVPVESPLAGEQYADQMVRFSPRQVVLRPGIAQAVRLQLRKPAELAEGEYRTHLLFQALPPANASDARKAVQEPDGLEIQLKAVYSVSIPVIVRHGATAATASISDVEIQRPANGPPAIAMQLRRSGSRSIYGDITVRHITPQGAERVVARANGVAVYIPNPSRYVVLPLPALERGVPPGQLRVTFSERPEQKGRAEAQASAAVR